MPAAIPPRTRVGGDSTSRTNSPNGATISTPMGLSTTSRPVPPSLFNASSSAPHSQAQQQQPKRGPLMAPTSSEGERSPPNHLQHSYPASTPNPRAPTVSPQKLKPDASPPPSVSRPTTPQRVALNGHRPGQVLGKRSPSPQRRAFGQPLIESRSPSPGPQVVYGVPPVTRPTTMPSASPSPGATNPDRGPTPPRLPLGHQAVVAKQAHQYPVPAIQPGTIVDKPVVPAPATSSVPVSPTAGDPSKYHQLYKDQVRAAKLWRDRAVELEAQGLQLLKDNGALKSDNESLRVQVRALREEMDRSAVAPKDTYRPTAAADARTEQLIKVAEEQREMVDRLAHMIAPASSSRHEGSSQRYVSPKRDSPSARRGPNMLEGAGYSITGYGGLGDGLTHADMDQMLHGHLDALHHNKNGRDSEALTFLKRVAEEERQLIADMFVGAAAMLDVAEGAGDHAVAAEGNSRRSHLLRSLNQGIATYGLHDEAASPFVYDSSARMSTYYSLLEDMHEYVLSCKLQAAGAMQTTESVKEVLKEVLEAMQGAAKMLFKGTRALAPARKIAAASASEAKGSTMATYLKSQQSQFSAARRGEFEEPSLTPARSVRSGSPAAPLDGLDGVVSAIDYADKQAVGANDILRGCVQGVSAVLQSLVPNVTTSSSNKSTPSLRMRVTANDILDEIQKDIVAFKHNSSDTIRRVTQRLGREQEAHRQDCELYRARLVAAEREYTRLLLTFYRPGAIASQSATNMRAIDQLKAAYLESVHNVPPTRPPTQPLPVQPSLVLTPRGHTPFPIGPPPATNPLSQQYGWHQRSLGVTPSSLNQHATNAPAPIAALGSRVDPNNSIVALAEADTPSSTFTGFGAGMAGGYRGRGPKPAADARGADNVFFDSVFKVSTPRVTHSRSTTPLAWGGGGASPVPHTSAPPQPMPNVTTQAHALRSSGSLTTILDTVDSLLSGITLGRVPEREQVPSRMPSLSTRSVTPNGAAHHYFDEQSRRSTSHASNGTTPVAGVKGPAVSGGLAELRRRLHQKSSSVGHRSASHSIVSPASED